MFALTTGWYRAMRLCWGLALFLTMPISLLGAQEQDRMRTKANLGRHFAAQLYTSSKADGLRDMGFSEGDLEQATILAGGLLAECYVEFFDNFQDSEREYLINISIMMPDAQSFMSRLSLLFQKYSDGEGDIDDDLVIEALDTLFLCGDASMSAAGFPLEVSLEIVEECTGAPKAEDDNGDRGSMGSQTVM